jgi:hypothetical protein
MELMCLGCEPGEAHSIRCRSPFGLASLRRTSPTRPLRRRKTAAPGPPLGASMAAQASARVELARVAADDDIYGERTKNDTAVGGKMGRITRDEATVF